MEVVALPWHYQLKCSGYYVYTAFFDPSTLLPNKIAESYDVDISTDNDINDNKKGVIVWKGNFSGSTHNLKGHSVKK